MGWAPKQDADRLIDAHRGYAHAIAAQVLRTVPPGIEKKDLEAAAELGLVEAASSFDPAHGAQFKTYAYYRIRGAVYDWLRKTAWFPKTLYQQYRFEAAANEFMKDYSSGGVSAGSATEEFQELQNMAGSVLSCYLLTLEGMAQEIAEPKELSPEQQVLSEEARRRVRGALAQLPEKNRLVVEGYYFQDLSLEEIGQKLGLSKSWVSRLHAKSLDMIRDRLEQPAGVPQAAKQETLLRVSR